ncbi:MAG: DUF3089 domain-containing protein [Tsuneonella sp.]
MARKFLYIVAALAVLVIAGGFALNLWSGQLTRLALVPTAKFAPQPPLASNAYDDPKMWIARPGLASDPARWQPAFRGPSPAPTPAPAAKPYAVFFIHPTSYIERGHWNAPLADADANRIARIYVKGLASPFNTASEIWAPRYRQATFGAFLTNSPEAKRALDAAYADVQRAFAVFLASVDPNEPIVLVGHSQGALHLLQLLREEVAGKPLARRIAAVYAVGWPISVAHDLPALGLPACARADQAGCVMSWSSFAEPADPSGLLATYTASIGFDGKPRGNRPILCPTPLTGGAAPSAPKAANRGTLVPSSDMTSGELVPGLVPARCDTRGLLLIGEPPAMGPAVLPGNNYHVYDIPLFWENVHQDVLARVAAWMPAR